MRLVDTDIMSNDMQTITVKDNTIFDFSQDGCYTYCLNVIQTSKALIKRGIAGLHHIATIYFNRNMSMELHDCIHKNILFEFNGKECDIDDCVRADGYIVCHYGNGMPYLQKGAKVQTLNSKICEYIKDQLNICVNWTDIYLQVSYGFGFIRTSTWGILRTNNMKYKYKWD